MSQLPDEHGQWLEQHRAYLTLLARTYLHPRNASRLSSSDLVQQTLLEAFATREQYRGTTEAELFAWLRQILKHNLLDAVREQRREKRDVRREIPLDVAVDASFSKTDAWLAAIQSSPSQRVARQEDLVRLSAAINELSEMQREAIVLHYLQGLKLADVAAAIDRTEAAVAGLLHRGLARLHALLDK